MVYTALTRRAVELSSRSLVDLPSAGRWLAALPHRRQEWLDMLGLWPEPPRTDLCVEMTGAIDRGDHVIEKLCFQPLPDVRITANLYRPSAAGGPLPAVVYVCGHSTTAKVHYQAHPRWFARHGYVALILDTIEVGEGTGTHHGTYSHGYWHWFSQGYSPAAIEVWAAMRAADLLEARPEVDPDRLGLTGLSGGGAISWFAGAADERFRVVAPICQTGTAEQQIRERTLDGHCDCTTWVNTLGWDWPDVGALIAPRPLFVGSATEDAIWRPWSNREILLRLRKLYRLLDAEDRLAFVEDVIPHGYSEVIRLPLLAWFEQHLKDSAAPVTDDLDADDLPESELRVFAAGHPPEGDRIAEVDRLLVPLPEPPVLNGPAAVAAHRERTLAELRRRTFGHWPTSRETPAWQASPRGLSGDQRLLSFRFESEPGLALQAWLSEPRETGEPVPVLVGAVRAEARSPFCGQGTGCGALAPGIGRGSVEVRGTGDTSLGPGLEWFVRRAYPMLGQSLPERRTLDLLRGVDVLLAQGNVASVALYGFAETAPLAIYAALLEPRITELVLEQPVATHWAGGPEFCGVLRVGDLPQNLAALCPRPLTFVGQVPAGYEWTRSAYATAGAAERVRVISRTADWRPSGQ